MDKFRVLSEEEISKAHEASIQVLSKTGMKVYSEKALGLLREAGASVDMREKTVKIPERMVVEALASVPGRINLYNSRTKELVLTLGDENTHVVAGHDAVYFEDLSSERRRIRKQDVADFSRIADALENIHLVGAAGMPQDVPARFSLAHGVDAVFNNTSKPLYFSPDIPEVTRAIFDIARVVSEEDDLSQHPILVCQVSPSAPLQWVEGAVEALMETARCGVPCNILPEPFAGMTAPVTLAGQLVIHNVEWLSGVVISQLIRKGTPVIYAGCWTTFDMKGGSVLVSSPETCVLRVAGTQMAKFYKVPSHSIGFDTEPAVLDSQEGAEKTLTALSALNTGVDLLVDAGIYDSFLVASHECLITDHDILGMLLRFTRGMEVTVDTLGVDLINKVGPGGSFVFEPHTLKYLRAGEHWESTVFNRCPYDTWVERGRPDAAVNAKKRAKDILASHQPPKLSQDKKIEIEKILERFESEFK